MYMHMFFFYDHAQRFLPDHASICSFIQGGGGKKNEQVILLKRLSFTNK